MLFCFGLFALLLYNTVVANGVCSFTFSKKEKIDVVSLDYQKQGFSQCEYIIKAPDYTDVIELNFTDLIGFQAHPGPDGDSKYQTHSLRSWSTSTVSQTDVVQSVGNEQPPTDDSCLPPELIITDETLENKDLVSNKICKTQHYKIPQVFQFKSHSLKIIYIWVRDEQSGFTLDIDFHFNNCAFICDESKCLLDKSVVCNQVYDCADQSDEKDCPAAQIIGASHLSRIVVIVVTVTLMPVLAVLICVASPCRSTSRMWRWRRNRDRGDVENRQLRPSSTGSETGVPSGGASSASNQDSIEQKVALLRERHILMQSAKSDMEIGLPPQIPISQDGEEGYVKSQKTLANYHSQDEVCQQFFRPPPNKIVYDIHDSPPPYISRSVSSIESLGNTSPGSRGRINMDPNNSCDVMLRCYSMPNNNNHINNGGGNRTPAASQNARHSRGKTNVQTSRLSLDRPPDYSQVVNIGVCNTSSPGDKV